VVGGCSGAVAFATRWRPDFLLQAGSVNLRSSAKIRQGSCSRCQRLMPRSTPRPNAIDVSMIKATRLGAVAAAVTMLEAMA
jgi:hypothetical protein